MRVLTGSVLSAAAFVLVAAVAWPQSLAEIAAREKERQEKEKRKAGGAAHVYTEDDLRGRGAGTYSQPGSAPAATAASPGPAASPGAAKAEKPKTEEEIRAEQENDWRDRLQKAQEEVTRLSAEADRLQNALNDLSQNLYSGTRTGLLNRMDQVQKDLAASKQKVTDLQEEGRRSRYR